MDSFLIEFLLAALATSYLTHILILERKTSHYGPFQSSDRLVLFKPDEEFEDEHMQPVTIFDWGRRLFGVYKVERHVWTVNEIASQRWTCPVCLSFWIAAAMLLLRFIVPHEIFMQLSLLLSLACVSSIVNVIGMQ